MSNASVYGPEMYFSPLFSPIDAVALQRSMHSSYAKPAKPTHADKLAQARARFGKPFACDPGSTFRFRRDRTILDDWLDTLREQRAAAQAEVPGLLREQAA